MNMEDDERRKIVFWSGPEKEEKLEAIRVKPIGSGTFGRCELIKDTHTGKHFCLKTCKLTQFDVLSSASVEFEKSLNFSHKNLVCAYFSWYDGAGQLQLITEYCQLGSINQILNSQELGPEQRIALAITCIVQVNSALAYLKTRNPPIFHRDIKFENLLVDANGVIKLADLGLAATHDLGQTHTQGAGTPYWLAPEVLHGREYDYPSDQYSLALVVLRLLNGVIKNDGTIQVPQNQIDPDVMDYLKSQLNVDPTKRLTAEEVLQRFKGKGGHSLRGVIKLPPAREKILSPYEITWQHTTTEERQRNDELRRLALAFMQMMDEEKDISVVVDALKVLPFDGVWTTKNGLSIQRRDGQISLPPGILGPQAPATPFKAAYMRNFQGKDNSREEDDEEPSEGPAATYSKRGGDDEPEKRRLFSETSDDSRKRLANNRRRGSKLQELADHDAAAAAPNVRNNARAASRLGGRRKSEHDDGGERGDSSGAEKSIGAVKNASAMRRRPERATTLARQRMREREREEESDHGEDDEPATPESSSSESREQEDQDATDPDAMDVDEVDEEEQPEEQPEERPEKQRPGRRKSRASAGARASIAAAPPSRRLTRSSTAHVDDSVTAGGAAAGRRSRTMGLSAASSSNSSASAPRPSIEDSRDMWQHLTVEERIGRILESAEWHADTTAWAKLPRFKFPESDSKIRDILASLLETDLVERSWVRSMDKTPFARKLWNWVVDQYDLWRDKALDFPNKKRKRAV